jgi:hypothetical protein
MTLLQSGLAKSLAVDYTIDQSLRFNDGDSAYLSRTFSAGDTTEWTFSCWVKRGNNVADGVSGSQKIFGAYIDGSNVSDINFSTNDIMDISEYVGGSTVGRLKTTQLFRDFSAWYHIVVVWDSDNVTSGDRYRLYVNGDRVTAFSTETQPSSAQASATNAAGTHNIGKQNTDEYYDGYLAEMYFIDGQSLDADDFGETDSTTNQWKPIDASGLTFGTNGFYQKYATNELANSFTDSSTGGVGSPHTITANGHVTNTTAQKKVGDSSIYFDGNDYLSIPPSQDFNFGSGNFTVEMWVYFNSITTTAKALWSFNQGNNDTVLKYKPVEGISFYHYPESGSSWNFQQGSATGWATGTWYHIALVRNGTSWVIYRDGISVATHTGSETLDYKTRGLTIGATEYTSGVDEELDGYIDEHRTSKGIARYTEAFDPPTTEFTSDAYTVLLIHSNWDGGFGLDSSGNGNNFTQTNLVATDQMVDSPTNNFCTIDAVDYDTRGALSEGNLKIVTPA